MINLFLGAGLIFFVIAAVICVIYLVLNDVDE